MAYIKNIRIKKTVKKAIDYVCNVLKTKDENIGAYKDRGTSNAVGYISNETKTMGGELVSCNFGDWRYADVLWEQTRQQYGEHEVLAHHFVQSFDPVHNITPEEAHKIGKELAEKQFGSLGFDYIVATHIDKHHIHNHILVNNVSRRGYEKVVEDEFGNKEIEIAGKGNAYWHKNDTYRALRKLNIDTCRNHGIPAVDARKNDEEFLNLHPEYRSKSEDVEKDNPDIKMPKEYRSTSYIKTRAYDSWALEQASKKVKIREDINKQIAVSNSWEDFVSRMEETGYKVLWKTKEGDERKNVTYVPPFGERGRRDDTLGDMFKKEMIEERIRKAVKKRNSPETDFEEVRKEFAKREAEARKKDSIVPYENNTQRAEQEEPSSFVAVRKSIKVSVKKDVPFYIDRSKYKQVYSFRKMKHYYVPRSILDQFFGEILYQQHLEIVRIREDRARRMQSGNTVDTSKMSLADKKAILDLEETIQHVKNTKHVIHFHNIKSVEDFLPLKMEVLRKQSEVNERIEREKEELLEVDKVLDMFESLEKYKDHYEVYNALPEGEDKDAHFTKFKTHIQNYAYAYRTLNNMNIDLAREDIYKDKRKEMQERLNEELKEIEALEEEMQSLDMAERDVRAVVEAQQKEAPEREMSTERNRPDSRR